MRPSDRPSRLATLMPPLSLTHPPTHAAAALGAANLAGAAFSCYTTTGSFSRSAVNHEVGSRKVLFIVLRIGVGGGWEDQERAHTTCT